MVGEGMVTTAFGSLLRRYRQAAMLSQEALAERAGLSTDAISVIERGKRGAPRPDTVALLARALGLTDDERTAFIAAARAVGAPVPAPAGESLAASRRASALPALPAPLTAFIGRAREVAAVRARLLEPATRLLTLTGPGGTGKTRLALEVARAVRDAFPAGVAVVLLAALTDPALVLPTIAHALGLGESAGRTPVEQLAMALAGERLLLVLDNVEQVTAAAPQLTELLVAAPGVTALATSRARLNVRGEHVLPVPPLSVPDLAQPGEVNDLLQAEAVQLFVARARDAAPDFELTKRNAADVVAICRRLDGLPLAIELAAARVVHLPPAALLHHLEGNLALLAEGPRDLPARQRTLRDTIAWSYALLDDQAQALFRRLCVFAGGCTLAAAEAVCRMPEGLPPLEGDMLAGLVELADQSLLTVAEGTDGEPRFGMLETIREYGLEQATEAGAIDALRRQHALHYISLVEGAERQLGGREQGAWWVRLRVEHDNLRAVLRWCVHHGEAERGLRLACVLWRFWWVRSMLSEGRDWLEALLALPAPADSGISSTYAFARMKALHGSGMLAFRQGQRAHAESLGEESLTLATAIGDREGQAAALNLLGLVARVDGNHERATRLYGDSLRLAQEIEHPWYVAHALVNLGLLAQQGEDYERAAALVSQGLALFQEMGETWSRAFALRCLATIALKRANPQSAGQWYRESLVLNRDIGDRVGIAYCLEGLSAVAGALGQNQRAGLLGGAAAALRAEVGAPASPDERAPDARDRTLADGVNAGSNVMEWMEGRAMPLEQVIAVALDDASHAE